MPQLRLLALWFSKLINLESIEGLDEAAVRCPGRDIVAWVGRMLGRGFVFEEGSIHSDNLEMDLQFVKRLMPFLEVGGSRSVFIARLPAENKRYT